MKETVLNSITTLKRHGKITSSVFLIKYFLMMTKISYFMINFLYKIEILQLNMLKLFETPFFFSFLFKIKNFPVFFLPKFSNFRFLQVKWHPCI